ncbi:MAG: pyridine nucleotide-disulfide oxidoreductase [Paenibacillaceae bacterium]|jgi:thioredoxin reductase|nr:pyridine nucleotide-disulfide oxidoreductase [Paenibacillaceae bacterium]
MYDVAIIGAGPTGASAALFTAKAGKKTLIIDGNQSITKRAWIENHYGVNEVSGPDLVENGKKQAAKFGAEIINEKAVQIKSEADSFLIQTESGEYAAKRVILATGLMTDLAEAAGVTTKPGTEPRVKTVIATDATGQTNIPGIYAAGGAAGTSLHTIITAGDGARVAIEILSGLNGERYVDHDVLKA